MNFSPNAANEVPAERPRILLTNDDGVDSPGIHILARELFNVAQVFMVVPFEEKSGASHSLTLGTPVEYEKLDLPLNIPGYAVKGTPVDCVHIGRHTLDMPFNLVVSGINSGANLGLNIHYSGTVAAAMEAAFFGCKGLAVSIATRKPAHLESAAIFAAKLARLMLEHPEPMLLNLNVPDLPLKKIRGVRLTRTSLTEEETALAVVKKCIQEDDECDDEEFVLDSRAVAAGFVSISALRLDLTDRGRMKTLQAWEWPEVGE
jgi:5'-nucleotidase